LCTLNAPLFSGTTAPLERVDFGFEAASVCRLFSLSPKLINIQADRIEPLSNAGWHLR
jgi:hypothetical protein